MKTYIAVTATLELKTAPKLLETVTLLAKQLIDEYEVHVSLLVIGEETTLLSKLTKVPTQKSMSKLLKSIPFYGKADLTSLSTYFDKNEDSMEDGHCFIFCDGLQPTPSLMYSRVSFSFGVFFSPQSYPQYYESPNWNTFEIPALTEITTEAFVEKCCKNLKLVTSLLICMKDTYGFSASPFPRMPQKRIFEDPEFLHQPTKVATQKEVSTNSPTATMHFCSFIPEGALQTLKSRGCTYFLQPSNDHIDNSSYFNISRHLITSHKIGLLRRTIGDYFLLRPYKRAPDATNVYLMLEYILSTSIKFTRGPKDVPIQKFRKHNFSYDGHTSFANQECMEMSLSRIGRMLRRETDDQVIKRDLMLAMRQIAASCHPQLAYALKSIIQSRVNEVSPNLQRIFRNLLRLLPEERGLKKAADYLEKEVPNSKIKSKLY